MMFPRQGKNTNLILNSLLNIKSNRRIGVKMSMTQSTNHTSKCPFLILSYFNISIHLGGGSLLLYWTADYLITLQTSFEVEVKEIKKRKNSHFQTPNLNQKI